MRVWLMVATLALVLLSACSSEPPPPAVVTVVQTVVVTVPVEVPSSRRPAVAPVYEPPRRTTSQVDSFPTPAPRAPVSTIINRSQNDNTQRQIEQQRRLLEEQRRKQAECDDAARKVQQAQQELDRHLSFRRLGVTAGDLADKFAYERLTRNLNNAQTAMHRACTSGR